MSIASQITALNADKTAIANAITAKGGTLSQNAGFDTFATDVATIPTGTSEAASVSKFLRREIQSITADYFQGLTELQQWLFGNNYTVKSVVLPNSIRTIGSYCFQSAINLETVILNEGITTLSNSAFAGCVKLNHLTIPSSAVNLGIYCLWLTGDNKTFTFLHTTPPAIQQYCLPPLSSITKIYVPHGTRSAYVAAPTWADYANVIEELAE